MNNLTAGIITTFKRCIVSIENHEYAIIKHKKRSVPKLDGDLPWGKDTDFLFLRSILMRSLIYLALHLLVKTIKFISKNMPIEQKCGLNHV